MKYSKFPALFIAENSKIRRCFHYTSGFFAILACGLGYFVDVCDLFFISTIARPLPSGSPRRLTAFSLSLIHISGVVYQPGAFTAITDGQINEAVAESAKKAAREALAGSDPSGGALYYYNPDKTSNKWIRTRPVIKRIGAHLFCS